MEALFKYAVSLKAVPCGATVGLQVTVKNATGSAVDCSGITIDFPHDADAGFLADGTAGIGLSVGPPASWQLTKQDDWTFVAEPVGVTTGLGAGEVLGLVFDKVVVDSTPGVVDLQITESTDQDRTAQIPVKKQTVGIGITELTASHVFVAPGDSVTVSWGTIGATGCTLSWNGNEHTGGPADSWTGDLEDTATFTLRADGTGGPVCDQIVVTVANPRITYYDYAPHSGVAAGGEVQLMWKTVNSQDVELQVGNEPMVRVPVNQYPTPYLVHPDEPTAYTLFANGAGVSDEPWTVRPVVNPVTIGSFSASPVAPAPGDSVTLSWQTEWATGCSIDHGVGAVGPAAAGSTVVQPPAGHTAYTLTAAGYQPKARTADVYTAPAITTLGLAGLDRQDQGPDEAVVPAGLTAAPRVAELLLRAVVPAAGINGHAAVKIEWEGNLTGGTVDGPSGWLADLHPGSSPQTVNGPIAQITAQWDGGQTAAITIGLQAAQAPAQEVLHAG